MKHYITIILLLSCIVVSAQKAETIIYNASVYTLDDIIPTAEAIAIDKGKIVRVGGNKEVLIF